MIIIRRALYVILVALLVAILGVITLKSHLPIGPIVPLASERFDYIVNEVIGYCLDVGCGRNNRFINEFLEGNGKGLDVFPYEGLTEENIVKDLSQFPFEDSTFDSVTFIANINHIPESQRDIEHLSPIH